MRRAATSISSCSIGPAREADLAGLRTERERTSQWLREREQEVAGMTARLASLEEFDAARAAYGNAARLVLAGLDGAVRHAGSVADHLDVAPGYERAVEACLGETLQFVIVPTHDEAERALRLVREHHAGRCGFAVADAAAA